ncbi:MAG TPA: DUF2795 domain-containing protein [Mycobacteriales bacterium]|jgi:hypothetical protein|nr:DUF2795 domain-containing protein [Mycobacteriales bacterium]
MERGNTKHGRQLDEALKHETDALTHGRVEESRAEEWRMAEPSGEDQPEAHQILDLQEERLGNGMSVSELDMRAEIAKHLRPSVFPAVRDVIVDTAVEEQSPAWIVEELSRLPAGREFSNMQDVWTALGHHGEDRRA